MTKLNELVRIHATLSAEEKGHAPTMDTSPSVETETRLESEIDRLKSRLAQGQRDHQRSHEELQRLEGDIRSTESELRTYRRENVLSAYTEEQLAPHATRCSLP